MNNGFYACRPCAEELKAEGRLEIGLSVKEKQTCKICGRRRFVYRCKTIRQKRLINETQS